MLGVLSTNRDVYVTLCCVRGAEGDETTPSFGNPSNVRRGKGGTAFGAERSEAAKDCRATSP